ncbi:MAG: ribbon-helix-helix domain-containing protein [Candidatus Glassbacteria bacterium]|nr:ribbon-helix-helix domain-containing protein [Candidatus Glassbacteria bacterium]
MFVFPISQEDTLSESKTQITTYILVSQKEKLKDLSSKTRVPISEYLREGIDLVLAKYRAELNTQKFLPLD